MWSFQSLKKLSSKTAGGDSKTVSITNSSKHELLRRIQTLFLSKLVGSKVHCLKTKDFCTLWPSNSNLQKFRYDYNSIGSSLSTLVHFNIDSWSKLLTIPRNLIRILLTFRYILITRKVLTLTFRSEVETRTIVVNR